MVTPILRQQCLELYSNLPVSNDIEEEYFFPDVFGKHIFTSDFKEDIEKLCSDVTDMVERLRFENLIFLGESEMPWLSQRSDTRLVKDAFEYFKNQNIGEQFNGGFLVNIKDLSEFVRHLFALTRFNAAFPVVYFTDEKKSLIGNLCKYGNLHIFTLSEKIDKFILSVAIESKFKLTDDLRC